MTQLPPPRVLLTDYAWPELSIERETLAAVGAELVVAANADEATLVAAAHEVDAILTCWARVTPAVLGASNRLRIVSRLGIGLDNIALLECARRGILVTNVPDYCVDEVAEHTWALILALARRIPWFQFDIRAGRYDLQAQLPLHRLRGRTLGIIGLGQIGRRVAEGAAALGLRVVATTRTPRPLPPGVEPRTFDELLAESDFVSLHAPATPETRHLIDARALARMKPSAYLINTSRGALVDEQALADALAAGKLAGGALDVQAVEPPDLDRPPFNDPRVLVTPHAAFVSTEAVEQLRRRAVGQIIDVLAGRTPPHVVQPAGEAG